PMCFVVLLPAPTLRVPPPLPDALPIFNGAAVRDGGSPGFAAIQSRLCCGFNGAAVRDGGSPRLMRRVYSLTIASMGPPFVTAEVDRKSTRLNSSHVKISYAVFCLKKKK